MSIQHHPDDELLLALAAGTLPAGQALLVTVHLDGCARCRAQLHTLQSLGGVLLEQVEPSGLAAGALADTLARIDAPAPSRRGAPGERGDANGVAARPRLPAGVDWPASMSGCQVSRWNWMGPGMSWSRVQLPVRADGRLFLLRIAPGRNLPRHSHSDIEMTQVLCGSFDDGRARFARGDFDSADAEVHHQPIVQPGEQCVCLAYVGGPLRFDGRLAGVIGGWVGL